MNLDVDISFGEDLVLSPEEFRLAAGIDRLADLRDRHVRELPSFGELEKRDHRRYLMSTLRDSLRKRERLWLIPFTAQDLEEWQQWLPAEIFKTVGPEQEYEGEKVTPMGIAPIDIAQALADRANADDVDFLRTGLREIDGLVVPTRLYRKLIAVGVSVTPRTRLMRWLTNPRVLAYIVVFVYSALRALPVTFVKEFHGSILLLWTIDLVTAIPYTWGVIAMVTAPRFKMRLVGLVVTVVTFMLPYIYFGLNGRDYPDHILFIIGCLIAGTFVLEGYKMWLDRRVRTSLLWRRRPQARLRKAILRHQQRWQRRVR
ncbi:MAG: hypothetical protein Q4P06_04250 [Actinomycetaceae bacterium]|nr:hypothetical protein [Actinomycetaceae bacterium]